MIRDTKPGIKAWVTSTSWNAIDRCVLNGNCEVEKKFVMDSRFIKEIHGNIYESEINGLIPWALMQNASFWNNPDPNPGCAFRVYDDGSFEIEKAYYYYKQVSRAGQSGMKVAYTAAMDSEIAIIAFASGKSDHPDAFVLINLGNDVRKVNVEVMGSTASDFQAYRTSGTETYVRKSKAETLNVETTENYAYTGIYPLNENKILYDAPANSVTTFYAYERK
jgi:hypothetical protein